MKDFSVEVESAAKYKVLRMKGELVLNNFKAFEDVTDKEMRTPPLRWILDCSELEYISSAGFGALMRVAARFKAVHGRLALIGVSESVMKVFKLLGLVALFDFYAQEADAAKVFEA